MTYRTNDKRGRSRVAIGYELYALADSPSPDGRGNVIDQDAVNELSGLCHLAHEVNWYKYVARVRARLVGKIGRDRPRRHPAKNS